MCLGLLGYGWLGRAAVRFGEAVKVRLGTLWQGLAGLGMSQFGEVRQLRLRSGWLRSARVSSGEFSYVAAVVFSSVGLCSVWFSYVLSR